MWYTAEDFVLAAAFRTRMSFPLVGFYWMFAWFWDEEELLPAVSQNEVQGLIMGGMGREGGVWWVFPFFFCPRAIRLLPIARESIVHPT